MVARVSTFSPSEAYAPVSPYSSVSTAVRRPSRFAPNLNPDLGSMALGMHQQAFVAVEEQLHRAAGDSCQHGGMDLAHDIFFAAKSAAHQLADHVHAFFRPAQSTRPPDCGRNKEFCEPT